MQPTLIIEEGVTLSIKLLTPDVFWIDEDDEEDAFVVVV
jgi:hypothetical protein